MTKLLALSNEKPLSIESGDVLLMRQASRNGSGGTIAVSTHLGQVRNAELSRELKRFSHGEQRIQGVILRGGGGGRRYENKIGREARCKNMISVARKSLAHSSSSMYAQ